MGTHCCTAKESAPDTEVRCDDVSITDEQRVNEMLASKPEGLGSQEAELWAKI